MKSTKVQTLGEPLVDGLGYLVAFTRGLPLVARGESDMSWLQHAGVHTRPSLLISTYTERTDPLEVSLF